MALVVSDGSADSAADTVLITTENSMPRADAGPDQTATSGDTVTLDGSGSADPDGTPLAFSWSFTSRPAGSAATLSDAAAVFPTFVVDLPGSHVVQLIVSDGELPSAPDTVLVTVEGSVVTVGASDADAAEAALDPGTFTVTRNGPTADALTVHFVLTGMAQNGVDYQAIATEVTIPAGEPSASLAVVPINDSLIEGAESVVLIVADDPAYTVGTSNVATVTIADDDVAVVTITATDPDAWEAGPTTGTFTFTRTGGTADPLVVFFTRSGTATGGNTGALDYAPIGTSVTIPAGASSADVVLTPLADNRVEGPETATLTLSPNGNIVVGAPDTASVTITDDPPVVTVVATDPEAAEAGADPGVFTFERTGGDLSSALTVRSSFGGTAANASDFAFISGLVTVPANATSATLTIAPLPDNRAEGAETMTVTIIPATGVDSYVIGTPHTATVTIADDPPVVTVTATDAAAAETGSDPGVFTFTRSGGDRSAPLNLLVSRSGTATNGGDYAAIGGPTFVVVIPAGQASATVTIAPVDDSLVEGEETVVLTLQPSTGYAIGSPGAATVTIEDDDGAQPVM